MKFRIKETRHTRNVSVDIDIKRSDEDFVGLLDVINSPTKIKPLVEVARKGLQKGNAPQLCQEGVGGTYFMHDQESRKIGVFKPQDEEPYNINNPKGYRPRTGSDIGFKEGILAGEASIRECAAYMLDHENFAGVPVTDLVLCQHPAFHFNLGSKPEDSGFVDQVFSTPPTGIKAKIGSFQEFISHEGDCEDIGRAMILKFPVDEVHKIAQLDIRIMNADRHGGNILYISSNSDYEERTFNLIPIDHGYALPSTLDEASFEWLSWPQAKEPMSEKTLEYIKFLDVKKEIECLHEKFGNTIREEHFRILRISTMLLQKGAKAGLSFYDIGSMVCRSSSEEPSQLEQFVSSALKMASGNYDNMFFDCLSTILDKEIDQVMDDS